MRPAPLPLLAMLLAGCAAPGLAPDPEGLPPAGDAPAADCAPPFGPTAHGVCALFLDPTGDAEPDQEVHLAAHPTEPGTILATWRSGEGFARPHIHAGLTRDGGRTWAVQELRDPSLDGSPLTQGRRNVDSVAAFSPDGEAYVHYAEIARTADETRRTLISLTLAASRDGDGWEYRRYHLRPDGVDGPDFMDLAVAPDTGALYVISQNNAFVAALCGRGGPCGAPTGVWFQRSTDGGATWSPQRLLMPTAMAVGHGAPRVAAGPGGLVLATGVSWNDVTQEATLVAAVSRDGGATFTDPAPAYVPGPGDPLFADPAAVWAGPDGAPRVALLFSGAAGMVHLPSPDAGATWGPPARLDALPPGVEPAWGMAAASPDGTLHGLQRYGTEDRLGALLYRLRPDGSWRTLSLVDAPGVDGRYVLGDDYGGLAVAADGSVWAAWSDARGGPARIAVARVP